MLDLLARVSVLQRAPVSILNLICLFSTLHLIVHLSSGAVSAGWVMWMCNTSVSESSSELVYTKTAVAHC